MAAMQQAAHNMWVGRWLFFFPDFTTFDFSAIF
jgi:hypothetical protein